MGSGISYYQSCRTDTDKTTKVTKSESNGSLQSVDTFLQVALLNLPQEDAIKAVVGNLVALSALTQYLALALLYTRNYHILISISKSNCNETLAHDTICQILTRELKISFTSDISPVQDSLSDSTIVNFTRVMFAKFLHSRFFDNWRIRETSAALNLSSEKFHLECTLPELESLSIDLDEPMENPIVATVLSPTDLITNVSAKITGNPSRSSLKFKYSDDPRGILLNDDSFLNLQKMLHNCDPIEVPKLLKYDRDGWMTSFLIAAETLPIGITLSSISRERPGYPVIYLNKHFADQSGHKRVEVLGERFGFMQRTGTRILEHSEASVSLATVALGTAQSVIVSIDITHLYNEYTSIVGIKPIFDNKRNYKFVIGLHLEIKKTSTSTQNIEEKIQLVKDLINLLPSTIC
eukprot:gene13547-28733_t